MPSSLGLGLSLASSQGVVISENLGPELITNGSFTADTDWTKGAGVTISGGQVDINSSAVLALYQAAGITIGKSYKLVLEIISYTSGIMQVWPGGTSPATTMNIPQSTGTHTFTFDLTAEGAANGNIIFGDFDSGNTYIMSMDNVSLKEIL